MVWSPGTAGLLLCASSNLGVGVGGREDRQGARLVQTASRGFFEMSPVFLALHRWAGELLRFWKVLSIETLNRLPRSLASAGGACAS